MTQINNALENKSPQKPKGGNGFVVQDTQFIRFIAVNEWLDHAVAAEGEGWVAIEQLHEAFEKWVQAHSDWGTAVIDNRTGFAKKVGAILAAKGWAYSYSRRKGARGLSGIRLRH